MVHKINTYRFSNLVVNLFLFLCVFLSFSFAQFSSKITSKTTSKVSNKYNKTPYERPIQEEIKKYQNAATPATTQRNTEMWLNRLKEFQNDIGYIENIEDIQSKSDLFSEPVFKPLLNVMHSKMHESEQLSSLDIKKGADKMNKSK